MFKAEQHENVRQLGEVRCNCVDPNSNVWYKQSGHVCSVHREAPSVADGKVILQRYNKRRLSGDKLIQLLRVEYSQVIL